LPAHNTELRIPEGGAGIGKLYAVKEIENFGAKLQAESFRDLGVLEGGEIVVGNPV